MSHFPLVVLVLGSKLYSGESSPAFPELISGEEPGTYLS